MRINRKEKLRDLCGEKMLFLRAKGVTDMSKVLSFNETSNFLWESLQGREFSVADVAKALTDAYDVTEETAGADAAKWVEQLKGLGLIDD